MSTLALLVALLCVVTLVSGQCGGDHGSIDFAASAPLTFDHKIGGGAWNLGENGRYLDNVESLEGGDWACGDYVTHLIELPMASPVSHDVPNSVRMVVNFTADTTGQSGVAYSDFGFIGLNSGQVRNGGRTQPVYGPANWVMGPDKAYKDTADPLTFKVLGKGINIAPIFTAKSNLWLNFEVGGLNPGDVAIIRIDVKLSCKPNSSPTGNLQASLLEVSCTNPALKGAWQAVPGGAQTVPLKSVSSIIGVGGNCVGPSNITGQDFTAKVLITDPNMGSGAIDALFYYSWSKGGFAIVGQSANYSEIHTYDEQCTPNHQGELQYNKGVCGCEITSIITDQPRFFLYNTSEYYCPGVVTQINGVFYMKFSACFAGPVSNLYYTLPNYPTSTTLGVIYRAELTDGRTFTFQNVVVGTVPSTVFTPPPLATTNCQCSRQIDIVLLMERTGYVDRTAFANVQAFASKFVSQFTISSTRAQVGTMWYDSSLTVVQSIANGNTLTNVQNAINSISCVSGKTGCGSNAWGDDIPTFIRSATAALLASPRSATAAKAIILVFTGWDPMKTTMGDAILAASQEAFASNIKIFAVVYNSLILTSEIQRVLTTPATSRYVIEGYSDANVNTLAVATQASASVCLASTTPCGAACCGGCDTTCGICYPVTACPIADTTNCSEATVIQGGCCVKKSGSTTCAQPIDPQTGKKECVTAACDAKTGQCTFTQTCVAPANDNCNNYTCNDGTCIITSRGSKTFCKIDVCVNGVFSSQPNPDACPKDNACAKYTCSEATSSCIVAPVANTLPNAGDLCQNFTCDPLTGWKGTAKVCTSSNKCIAPFCNSTNGQCDYTQTSTNPSPNANDPCYISTCDSATGWNTVPKDCNTSDPCITATCQSGTCRLAPVCNSCSGSGNCAVPACLKPCANQNCVVATCQGNNCNLAPKVCNDNNPCTTDSCDLTTGNCTFVSKNCTARSKCETAACDTNGNCVYTPVVCNDGLPCTNDYCDPAIGCQAPVVTCNTLTACETGTCNPANNQCQYSTKNCSGSDPCIVYTCDSTTGCKQTPIDCADSDPCTDDQCVAGGCVHTPKTCDDNVSCTVDVCKNGVCSNTPDVSLCTDSNPCNIWECQATGCVSTKKVCPPSSDNMCVTPVCIDYAGCSFKTRECNITNRTSDCSITNCNTTTGECTLTPLACATNTAIIVTAALASAAVVGIIIAVIACLGVSGGVSYAVYSKMNDGGAHAIVNNPLYVDQKTNNENPLFKV